MAVLLQSIKLCSHKLLSNYPINCMTNGYNYFIQIKTFVLTSTQKRALLRLGSNNEIIRKLSQSTKRDDSKRNLFSWKSFMISGGTVAIFLMAFLQFKREKMLRLEKERRRSIGKTSIGGEFDLIDQNGNRLTSKDLLGQWILLYFGFTHCPDICPDEIEKMVKAVDIIEKIPKMDKIVSLFITVDPERDTPEAIKGYLKEFSDKIIGLTGTKEQIEAATRAFRVYYSAGPRDHENDYIVDHTIIMYLINPNGEFIDYYGQTKTAEDIANGVTFNVIKFRNANKKLSIF